MSFIRRAINRYLLKLSKKIKAVVINEKQHIQKNVASFEVGVYTYGVENICIDRYIGSDCNIKIGKYCSISKNVTIITGGNHPINWVSTFPFRAKFNLEGKFKDGMPFSNGDIYIGNDVWIGTGVTILSGVKIGDGAVIAANATITKNVPAYAVVAGLPCKIIKYRFDNESIEKLLKIKWWNWDEHKVQEMIPLLSSSNINEFFEKHLIVE